MNKTIFGTGVLFGVLAVVFGAFGAHALKQIVSASALQTFETAVQYQMYHALVLIVLGSMTQLPERLKKWSFYTITIGTFFFSFSIYALALNALTSFDFKVIGFLTPLGGTLLIIGWIILGIQVLKNWN